MKHCAGNAKLAGVFVIERGEDAVLPLSDAEAAQILVENSDDAYGFPPYHEIKHLLYQVADTDLRPLEQATIAKAVAGLPAVHLRSSTRNWWQQIPVYMGISTVREPVTLHQPARCGGWRLRRTRGRTCRRAGPNVCRLSALPQS